MQGIGYRMWVQRTGFELGLRGAVRNRRDGSVELRVVGEAAAIGRFERWLSEGPYGARVTRVERTESILPVPDSGFSIEATV